VVGRPPADRRPRGPRARAGSVTLREPPEPWSVSAARQAQAGAHTQRRAGNGGGRATHRPVLCNC
jgi:hypothetical protein